MKYIKFGLTLVARGLWSRKAAVCVWCCVLRCSFVVMGIVPLPLCREISSVHSPLIHQHTNKKSVIVRCPVPQNTAHGARGPRRRSSRAAVCSLRHASLRIIRDARSVLWL